jgi:hypothetical protein
LGGATRAVSVVSKKGLDATEIKPGDKARLNWEVAGSTTRLARFELALEGREEACYARGTDRVTVKETFHRVVLFESDSRLDMQQGRCDLALPLDAPPTFKAANNRLRWVVVVHGNVPRWPDIKAEWELSVQSPQRRISVAARGRRSGDDQAMAIVLGPSKEGHVEGEVSWNLPASPRNLELRLFWYTSGRGTRDVGIVDRMAIDNAGAQGRQTFNLSLPPAPRPFAGKLLAIVWALEFVAEPGGQVARLDLPITEVTPA